MKPTVYAFSAAINACAESGRWQHAMVLLKSMESVGPAPNAVTYIAAMHGCLKADQYTKKKRLSTTSLVPDSGAYTSAISACERGQRWWEAVQLLDDMQAKGVKPKHSAYFLAMRACTEGRRW